MFLFRLIRKILRIIGYFMLFWAVCLGGFALYTLNRPDAKFITNRVNPLTTSWDRHIIEADLDSHYSVAWTQDMRKDFDAILAQHSTSADLDKVLATAQQTLGRSIPQGTLIVSCVSMEKDPAHKDERFCQTQPVFASGKARFYMTIRPNPSGDKAHAYKITGLFIEYPFRERLQQR